MYPTQMIEDSRSVSQCNLKKRNILVDCLLQQSEQKLEASYYIKECNKNKNTHHLSAGMMTSSARGCGHWLMYHYIKYGHNTRYLETLIEEGDTM